MITVMFAAAALSAGAPTYLNCHLEQEGRQLPVEVSLNESEQAAVISLSTGRVVKRLAVFSPNKVTISDEYMTWVIDRTTLVFTRDAKIGDKVFNETGACKLAPAPAERAF